MNSTNLEDVQLPYADEIVPVIIQKELFKNERQVTIDGYNAFNNSNLFHQGLLFRFYRDKKNIYSIIIEIETEVTDFSLAPMIDDITECPITIDPITERLLCETNGTIATMKCYVVNTKSTQFRNKYYTGFSLRGITFKEMCDVWDYIKNYEAMFGRLYVLLNVIKTPDRSQKGYVFASYMRNMTAPYIHDNTCCSFVARVMSQFCNYENIESGFLPYRNYISHFVNHSKQITKIDTSSIEGVRIIYNYFVKIRKLLKLQITKSNGLSPRLITLINMCRFEYIVVFQWNVHTQTVDYFKINTNMRPFLAFGPYIID